MTASTQKEYWSGKVGDEWATNAARLDAMLAPMTGAALQLAAFQPGERVLDIGCGAGATSLAIARAIQPGGGVTGVDLSPQMLSVARARAAASGLDVTFLEADAGATELPHTFDAAFSRFGVMFFEDAVAAFANLRTQVRGRLVFVCWRALGENAWATTPIDAIRPMLTAPLTPPDPDAPGPFSLADGAKVERVLAQAGWRDVALTPWDGAISIGGGGSLEESADFMLRIGPCARAIADQALDLDAARRRLLEALMPLHRGDGLTLGAACWLVRAL